MENRTLNSKSLSSFWRISGNSLTFPIILPLTCVDVCVAIVISLCQYNHQCVKQTLSKLLTNWLKLLPRISIRFDQRIRIELTTSHPDSVQRSTSLIQQQQQLIPILILPLSQLQQLQSYL